MTILAIYSPEISPNLLRKNCELKKYGIVASNVDESSIDEGDCRQIIHLGNALGCKNIALLTHGGTVEQIYNEPSLDDFIKYDLRSLMEFLLEKDGPIYLYIIIDSDVSAFENILYFEGGEELICHIKAYGGWCPLFYDIENGCITVSDRFSILCQLK